jgi:hypothetical protein
MRAFFVCALAILPPGCVTALPKPAFPALDRHGVRVIDLPAAGSYYSDATSEVIRTPAEFEALVDRVTKQVGADDPNGFVARLQAGRPDFETQALVLVRHDASSDSGFRFRARVRSRTLICEVRTRRQGNNRDYGPHWFAVVVDKRAVDRVEVRVDGQRQEELRLWGP